ncbi:MAG: hypothetical protein JOY86_02295 [Candidatus Eremiobacteraeota bacterium]|nr:hypothetical protein [Candidatus Eremiobacteraeota bacterium]
MKRLSLRHVSAFIALGIVCAATPAHAADRAVGDQLVYTLKSTTSGEPANLPPMVRGTFESNQAFANKLAVTLTLHIDSVKQDGTARASGTAVTVLPPGTNPMTARSFGMNGKDLQATILADGAIVPDYVAPSAPQIGESRAQQQADAAQFNANYAGGLVHGHVTDFNEFALGCSKRTTFKTGDAWRLADATTQTTWTFAVTGTDQVAGHNVVVVTMNAVSALAAQTVKQSITGDYDPVAHLVVRFHEDIQRSSDQTGNLGQTEDIALQ